MSELKRNSQQGFTIIELMIATTVLSVILVMVSFVMIGIGSLYFKGINQSRVQGSTRAIIDEVSQQLQFSTKTPITASHPYAGGSAVTVSAYCIGSTRYSYVLHLQLGTQIKHVLWRDTIQPGECDSLTNPVPDLRQSPPSPGGEELMPPRSRLTSFPNAAGLSPSTASPYQLVVGIAYGDDDLLNDPMADSATIRCLGNSGQQFCATAHLETIVLQRLIPSE